jgi:AraC-like DNA-binding protein
VSDQERRLTGLSATGLTVRFNAVLGRTPIMEVRTQRIARAKQLLRDTDWSPSEIARQSCFNSVFHFYHAFKDFCGVSPLQFRRQARGG